MCSAPAGEKTGQRPDEQQFGGSDCVLRQRLRATGSSRHALLHTWNACNSVKPSHANQKRKEGERKEVGCRQVAGIVPVATTALCKMIRQSEGAS